jgi:hypothetical protein
MVRISGPGVPTVLVIVISSAATTSPANPIPKNVRWFSPASRGTVACQRVALGHAGSRGSAAPPTRISFTSIQAFPSTTALVVPTAKSLPPLVVIAKAIFGGSCPSTYVRRWLMKVRMLE